MDTTAHITSSAECRKLGTVLSLIGDKWTVMIIAALLERPRRFNDLKRTIGGISQQMLTRSLKALERDGMVSRTVHPAVPPQVEYALTDLGHSLAQPVRAMGIWARLHLDEIASNRMRYDGRNDPTEIPIQPQNATNQNGTSSSGTLLSKRSGPDVAA